MADRKWEPNETQKEFLKILGENPDGITLREIAKKYGKVVKSGSINSLASKGLVNTDGIRTFVADIVYDSEVIGHKTYNDTVYKLAE